MQQARETAPDIVVLNWMLPKLPRIEICRQFTFIPETRRVPIIMISTRMEEFDHVRGLETGADDYAPKPYSVVELMAHVRS